MYPRVTLITDREWFNLDRIIRFTRAQPGMLALGGIVTIDGELDPVIKGLAYRYGNMALGGVAVPEIIDGHDTYGMLFDSPTDHFRYHHAPYNPKELETPRYRKQYARKLAELVAYTKSNIVFLSNFMVRMPENFLEEMRKTGAEVINVHPSVLPLLIGGLTEHRAANLGEHPDAAGFTIHRTEKELDRGIVYFQQKVRIDPYNKKVERRMGKERYQKDREERLRLKIIMAQSRYVPAVLAMIASETPRAVVCDQDAFALEGRRKFFLSEAYQQELHKTYDEWAEKQTKPVTYEEWYRHVRTPYRRMVFQVNGKWQILETILGAKQYAQLPTPKPLRRYEMEIPATSIGQVIELGKLQGNFFEDLYDITFVPQGPVVRSSFVTGLDLAKRVRRIDPNFRTTELVAPTRMRAPRKHTAWTVDGLPKLQEYTFTVSADEEGESLIRAIQKAISQQTDATGDLLLLGGGFWADVDKGRKLLRVHLQTAGDPIPLLRSFGVLVEHVEFLAEIGPLPKPSQTASGLTLPK